MAKLAEQVQAQLNDLDSQIIRLQDSVDTQLATLKAKREALLAARKVITPELESAVNTLRELDLLHLQ